MHLAPTRQSSQTAFFFFFWGCCCSPSGLQRSASGDVIPLLIKGTDICFCSVLTPPTAKVTSQIHWGLKSGSRAPLSQPVYNQALFSKRGIGLWWRLKKSSLWIIFGTSLLHDTSCSPPLHSSCSLKMSTSEYLGNSWCGYRHVTGMGVHTVCAWHNVTHVESLRFASHMPGSE